MKFLYKESTQKKITDQITLIEYCDNMSNLPIDGAYAEINGSYGPKTNKTFTELFFVISGKLMIEIDNFIHELGEKDLFIVPQNTKHKILAKDKCEVFIACAPQFNSNDVEFCG